MRNNRIRLAIGGAYTASSGYPNVKYLLELLSGDERLELLFYKSDPGNDREEGLFAKLSRSPASKYLIFIQHLLRNVFSVLRCLFGSWLGKLDAVYLPYPAVIPLYMFSLLPARLRPALIGDAFISLYDTIVNDRGMLAENSISARALLRIERRALHCATAITTDTLCNRDFLVDVFRLDQEKVHAIPLAIDENTFRLAEYRPHPELCRVLFVGTFVPLHGAEIVAKAACLLDKRQDIRFKLIGNGQTAPAVENILNSCSANIEWEKNWQSHQDLHKEILNADICLGIFGTTDKTKRVWPFKNYLTMSVGRPLITGAKYCTHEDDTGNELQHAFECVENGNPEALAETIERLADNPDTRAGLAKNAALFYQAHLSNTITARYLVELLEQATGS